MLCNENHGKSHSIHLPTWLERCIIVIRWLCEYIERRNNQQWTVCITGSVSKHVPCVSTYPWYYPWMHLWHEQQGCYWKRQYHLPQDAPWSNTSDRAPHQESPSQFMSREAPLDLPFYGPTRSKNACSGNASSITRSLCMCWECYLT